MADCIPRTSRGIQSLRLTGTREQAAGLCKWADF
jgi:hypothetical protein